MALDCLSSLDTISMKNEMKLRRNLSVQNSSGLIGLFSCGSEHHTGDYVKDKTEEVLLKMGITKVGHDDGIFQKVGDNDSNMVKDCRSLPCIDHTIERIVRILWFEPKVKESFDEDKKVVTFFKSSVKQEC